MGTIDNVPVILFVERGLSTKFTSEEFGGVGWGATEGSGDIGHVRDNSLDAIALAFNFGGKEGHTINET